MSLEVVDVEQHQRGAAPLVARAVPRAQVLDHRQSGGQPGQGVPVCRSGIFGLHPAPRAIHSTDRRQFPHSGCLEDRRRVGQRKCMQRHHQFVVLRAIARPQVQQTAQPLPGGAQLPNALVLAGSEGGAHPLLERG